MPSAGFLPINIGHASARAELAGGSTLINGLVDSGGANYRRPGSAEILTATGPIPTSPMIGAFDHAGILVFVSADRKIWKLDFLSTGLAALSSSDLTTQLAGAGRPTFASDGKRLIIAGGGALQEWPTGAALTNRLVVDPPADPIMNDVPEVSQVVAIANYIVVNDLRNRHRFQWSRIGDGEHNIFPQLAFTTADARPDPIVALSENARELYVFGETTTQVYGIAPDPFLPFSAVTTINRGCGAAASVIRVDDDMAWLDERGNFLISSGARTGAGGIISDDIANELSKLPRFDDCWGARVEEDQFDFLLWTFPSAGRSYAFDLDRKIWSPWYQIDEEGKFVAPNLGCHVFRRKDLINVVGLADSTWVTKMSLDSVVDFDRSSPIIYERILPFVNGGSNAWKGSDRSRYTMLRGTQDIDVASPAWIETSYRDDHGDFSAPRRLNLGVKSDRMVELDDFEGGIYTTRQRKIRYSGEAKLSLASIEEFAETRGL
jgi:hypothetical protein